MAQLGPVEVSGSVTAVSIAGVGADARRALTAVSPRHPSLVLRQGAASAHDGTALIWQATETPVAGAPTLFVLPGLGMPPGSWEALLAFLGDRVRFVTYRYRGLDDVAVARESGVDRHIEDVAAVMRAAGVSACTLVGFGVGVKLALAAAVALRDHVTALVLIAGAAAPSPRSRHLGRRAFWQQVTAAAFRVARRAWSARGLGRAARQLAAPRLVSSGAVASDAVVPLIEALASIEASALAVVHALFASHDASALGATIRVPALLVAGAADPFVPLAHVHQLARQLERSELAVVPRGGHFLGVEHPDFLNLRVERFLDNCALLERARW